MHRSFWDDEKCHLVWQHLKTASVYRWPWTLSSTTRFVNITGIRSQAAPTYCGSDLTSAIRLREFGSDILRRHSAEKVDKFAQWIVADWGGIKRGKDVIPIWLGQLRPFNEMNAGRFIREQRNYRVSSWSKILSFLDFNQYAIYDSRTAVALNAALIICEMNPRFHIPAARVASRTQWIKTIRSLDSALFSGYQEYLYLLRRFVELGLVENILDAERRIFSGSDETAEAMMRKLGRT